MLLHHQGNKRASILTPDELASNANVKAITASVRDRRSKLKAHLSTFVLEQAETRQSKLYRPPVVRQFWGDEQVALETSWGELFFDLVFVAVVFKLGNQIDDDIENEKFGQCLLTFFGMFNALFYAWFTRLIYFSRFATSSFFHKLTDILASTLVAFMALFITTSTQILHSSKFERDKSESSDLQDINFIQGFSLFFLFFTLVYFMQYLEVKIITPRWSSQKLSELQKLGIQVVTGVQMKQLFVVIFLAFASVLTAKFGYVNAALGILLASYFVGVFTVFILNEIAAMNHQRGTPIHLQYSINRLGEFTMLVLGEGVLQIILAAISDVNLYRHCLAFALSFVILALLQLSHFYMVPMKPEHHGFHKSRFRNRYIIATSTINYGALIFVGVGMKTILKHIDELLSDDPEIRLDTLKYEWLFCMSLALSLVLLVLHSIAHNGIIGLILKKDLEKNSWENFKNEIRAKGTSNINWPHIIAVIMQLLFPLLMLNVPGHQLSANLILMLGFFVVLIVVTLGRFERKVFRDSREDVDDFEERDHRVLKDIGNVVASSFSKMFVGKSEDTLKKSDLIRTQLLRIISRQSNVSHQSSFDEKYETESKFDLHEFASITSNRPSTEFVNPTPILPRPIIDLPADAGNGGSPENITPDRGEKTSDNAVKKTVEDDVEEHEQVSPESEAPLENNPEQLQARGSSASEELNEDQEEDAMLFDLTESPTANHHADNPNNIEEVPNTNTSGFLQNASLTLRSALNSSQTTRRQKVKRALQKEVRRVHRMLDYLIQKATYISEELNEEEILNFNTQMNEREVEELLWVTEEMAELSALIRERVGQIIPHVGQTSSLRHSIRHQGNNL